ncbi:insulinase family protein [Litorilituus sediminis]|uniref:Protease 3 n=1 Tax=Litorilituus sediminis TaxID=718192 RepID=A0A4P6P1X2_9GAMM|nr:insulinase family protein [Litorilituus sediminis]QBG35024.1 peptidase M16 [Litorilituus sediminis]
MKQSPNDLKHYQATTLSNGLRVLLIQNKESAKSAAALAVNVGHFNDPKDRQGLAHFLEHMLFLGTEKFPDGSEYNQFISQHGGSNNAWTGTEHTCFFFDIQSEHFVAGLARFSQFFISPLLSEDFARSERNNIDAEFKLKLKDDIRRLYDVHKETINQAHPFSQFSVGNIDTLADRNNQCINTEVQDFFHQFYRADYMTLALEGPQSLNELATLAQQMFSEIKAADKPLEPIKQPLYLPEHQQIKIDVCPVKNDHQLIISFAMESIDKYYQDKPESMLAYLLGHEGKGSILSLLKQQQWALALTAGSGINGSNFKDFNISISLTELGEAHLNDIIEVVFSYIGLLKSSPIAEHYYQEKQQISELSFNYHEKTRAIDNVSHLVINMQHYPVEDYIYGDYKMTGLCEKNINTLLNYLAPENVRIIHVSQANTFSKTSHWYQVPYQVQSIASDLISHWHTQLKPIKSSWAEHLALPKANPYIVAKPHVYPDAPTAQNKPVLVPKIIIKESGLTVWYKQDNTFKVPKGYIYVGIDSPQAIASAANIAMTRLFVELYSAAVVEENYDAELAGIHYHLYAHQGGVTLQLSGISEKQHLLLPKLLNKLKTLKVSVEQFELFKRQLSKHWQNSDKSKSISLLFANLSSFMQPNNPSSEKLVSALANCSYQDYCTFSQNLFNQVTIEALIHGNWLNQDAIELAHSLKQTFAENYHSDYQVQCPVLDIENQGTLLLPMSLPEHDHASVIYIPVGSRELLNTALAMVTSHLLSPIFFQEMRTEKQYGYLVGVGYVPINRYPGIAFYIQSPHTEAVCLSTAIVNFINQCVKKLNSMSTREWENLTTGLASQLKEKDQSLRIKSQRFWASICNQDDAFEQKSSLLKTIQSLTLAQAIDFIGDKLANKTSQDKLMLLSVKQAPDTISEHISAFSSSLNGKIISNSNDFVKKSKRKF